MQTFVQFFVKSVRFNFFLWEQLDPRWAFELFTQHESIVFRIGPPPRGGLIKLDELRELFTPKEGSVGKIVKRRRDFHFLREAQQRKASLPMRLNFGGSQMSTRCTQYEKVDPHMALISVHMRSTWKRCLQFSQAIGPRKLTSGGSRKRSMPDPQKLLP